MSKNSGTTVVARMRAHIRAHLQEPITASDIAKAAGYSQYHAARLFKEEIGVSPFEYIRRERLLQAASNLRGGKPKVLDVAMDYVFDSHEGFTRAFVNAFGITPKKYATYPSPKGWHIPRHFLDRQKQRETRQEEQSMNKETAYVFVQIMERPARKLMLFRGKKATGYFEYCAEVGCTDENTGHIAPWDILTNVKEAIHEPVGLWLPENMRPPGTSTYAHGVEIPADYAGEVPEGFDVIDLEPCKFLVFQGETYDDANFMDAVGSCMGQINKFNPEVYGYKYAYDLAPKMQLAPMGWRGYIEMHPVKEVK